MKKLAIIGASYLQRPLVEKAKEMGFETHVFAWRDGNVVDDIADFYYPISILDKDEILKKCQAIGIDGVTSIASDIAMPAVNYIAENMHLIGNSVKATLISTDKFEMRKALNNVGIPSPEFAFYDKAIFDNNENFQFPVIVKPTDRSGSRGVTKVEEASKVNEAIDKAIDNSIHGRVIIEEFMVGREFSVEMISYQGKHQLLAVTDKVTTGEPYFVEIAHHQPAAINQNIKEKIAQTVKKGLDALQIKNGASHSEVFLTSNNEIRIVEIAGRMGGDLIGSHLVPLSTGFDFMKAVIQVALGEYNWPQEFNLKGNFSGMYFVLPRAGKIQKIINHAKEYETVKETIPIKQKGDIVPEIIDGSGTRAGIIVYAHPNKKVELNPLKVLEFQTV